MVNLASRGVLVALELCIYLSFICLHANLIILGAFKPRDVVEEASDLHGHVHGIIFSYC